MPSVLSLGGGVNSTAMLLELADRDMPPDLVLFADTGGELPATYAHVDAIEQWCGFKNIMFHRVTNAGRGQGDSLEDNCLKRKELPSLAYGFKGCSVKWKRQPMDRFVREWLPAKDAWARGERVTRYIGIDIGERHRADNAKMADTDKYDYQYPLVEWEMDRTDCIMKIEATPGFTVPPKSSCFFCPAMRRGEILRLQSEHPELLERALRIEENAETHTTAGLGRNWKWSDFLRQDNAQGKLWPEIDAPCGCFDESED